VGVIFSASSQSVLVDVPNPFQKQGEQTYVCKARVIKFDCQSKSSFVVCQSTWQFCDPHSMSLCREPPVCASKGHRSVPISMTHSERSVLVPRVRASKVHRLVPISMTNSERSVLFPRVCASRGHRSVPISMTAFRKICGGAAGLCF
jgi:hypothetical protein